MNTYKSKKTGKEMVIDSTAASITTPEGDTLTSTSKAPVTHAPKIAPVAAPVTKSHTLDVHAGHKSPKDVVK